MSEIENVNFGKITISSNGEMSIPVIVETLFGKRLKSGLLDKGTYGIFHVCLSQIQNWDSLISLISLTFSTTKAMKDI